MFNFNKSIQTLVIISLASIGASAFAGNLSVTCGQDMFEALQAGKPSNAEFSVVLELQGPNKAVVTSFQDTNQNGKVKTVDYALAGRNVALKLTLDNMDTYSLTLKDCKKLDTAQGDVSYQHYLGPRGINPYDKTVTAKCSCLNSK